jgi:hypothetical protein
LNVRWSTSREQNLNRRVTLFDAERLPLKILSERTGINYMTLRDRKRRGVDLNLPGNLPESIWHAGESKTAQEWSEVLGVPYTTVRRRYRQGKSIDRRERAVKCSTVNMN